MPSSYPFISIITPVDPSRMEFFSETIASVVEAASYSYDFEWIVQVDGVETECAKEALKASANIQANLVHCGPGATRNFALQRAKGLYVRNLDADDVLLPQAITELTAFLQCYGLPAWAVSAVVDMENGKPISRGKDTELNPIIPAGELVNVWTEHLPVHPTTLCIQSDIARALGGWMGLPASEDTGLLMAVSTLYDGGYLATPTVLYRRSQIQMSTSATWGDLETRYAIARRRAECIARIMAPIKIQEKHSDADSNRESSG